MAADSKGEEQSPLFSFHIDPTYEFSAPRYFNFMDGETEEEKKAAELWFERGKSYAPSPFMPKIKKERSVQLESLCNFEEAEEIQLETGSESKIGDKVEENNSGEEACREEDKNNLLQQAHASVVKPCADNGGNQEIESLSLEGSSMEALKGNQEAGSSSNVPVLQGACSTPKTQIISTTEAKFAGSSRNQTAKKIAALIQKPASLKSNNRSQMRGEKSVKSVKPKNLPQLSADKKTTTSVRRYPGSVAAAKNKVAIDIALENQAIKRQKLEGGGSRQILNVKNPLFPHKSKLGLTKDRELSVSAIKCGKEEKKVSAQRKVYVREKANPFVSTAELIQKFQSSTRKIEIPLCNRSLSQEDNHSIIQKPSVLKLTQPKEPELQTAHRARPMKLKSTAELEEEMLANMPTFKARPVNKKILEAPSLPALLRSNPHPPEFREFHLHTKERAGQLAGSSVPLVSSSVDSSCQNQSKHHKLTEPKPPRLETSLRARPTRIKSSEELEQEELEKVPQFKARPLNKKIFECKGSSGVFCNRKPQITIPHEFHFATDERMPPSKMVVDLFDKLSLHSEPTLHRQQLPRITTPNPFHLYTEERGMEKERRLAEEILHKQLEEERARIPKASPYPYTTDIPDIPPKPEPKGCTKPEAFQLESLVRHEEMMQRKVHEMERIEEEEAKMRIFKAQPVMKEDPIPLPEKARKPLTQVQDFVLQVDHRAVDRAEFDKKIKEKEIMYKRFREESEMNQKIEEEKELKQMRRTMVPHARPVPNFANPFLPQRSTKEITKAKSPKLHVIQRRQERRKVGAASAAADMR